MVDPARIRRANDAPLRPERAYVLYWMTAARRTRYNPALERAVWHAEQLGRPLLVFEALRLDHRWASTRVHTFVREIEQTIAPQVRKRNNTLMVHCQDDAGSVIADRGKLKQVLLNLLGNATKFTNDGEISLHARRDFEQSSLTFEVRDTGIGIDTDKLTVIFEKFTQIDASPTRRYEGTGLGLAITRELCAMMGASIDVNSRPGAGTCFTVTLPIQVAAPGQSMAHAAAASLSTSGML